MKSKLNPDETKKKIAEEGLSEGTALGKEFKDFLLSMGLDLEKENLSEKKTTLEDLAGIISVFFKARNQERLAPLSPFNLKTIDYSIIDHLLLGKSNKEIAMKVQLSEKAVKYHLGKNFKKFEVKNRNELRSKLKILLNLSTF